MHESNRELCNLQAEYAELAGRPVRELTADERHGLAYYFADIGDLREESLTVRRWVAFVHDLDAFVGSVGRWPRSDARRPRPVSAEQTLVDQLAYQRRDEVRANLRTYQARRLEVIPGFQWAPQHDRWQAALEKHQAFWRTRRRPPRRRSSDPGERAIARWVAHQRSLYAASALDGGRARKLLEAEYRVL